MVSWPWLGVEWSILHWPCSLGIDSRRNIKMQSCPVHIFFSISQLNGFSRFWIVSTFVLFVLFVLGTLQYLYAIITYLPNLILHEVKFQTGDACRSQTWIGSGCTLLLRDPCRDL